jgi:hypothetical protein
MSLDQLGQLSAIVAALVAILGFPLIFQQLRVAGQQRLDAIKLSGSQVLLAVDAVLAAYQDINRNLRPKGIWHGSTEHPTVEELPLVEPYLGIFERLWIAYSIGQIDIATIEHLYGYRIRNIWANPRLVESKLQNKHLRDGWSMLISLTYALENGNRFTGHTDDWQPQEWLAWRKRS